MGKHTMEELKQWQALPLSIKVRMSQERIRMWVREYGESGVYVSFSGGKDSTVLSHLVDRTIPNNDIPRVFVNTGLEYPEIVSFVKQEPRAVIIRPKMNFKKVIEKYGYPFFSKEISEAVYGARRYLDELIHRQTDRQTDNLPNQHFYNKLCGLGEYAKSHEGGHDSKYRKLRGIGEYSSRKNEEQKWRFKFSVSGNVRDSNEGQSDKGEYP